MSSFYGNLGGGGNGQSGGSDAYNLANEYNNALTYNIGDYCIYNNMLYKCNTAILSNEDWNPAHWTEVKVTDEIVSASGSGGIFVVPLTFVSGGEEDVTAKDNYKGVWDANTTYEYDDIVKVIVYDENPDVDGYNHYVGVYDPTISYNEGDIVYYMEDITQRAEYKGNWDSSVTYNTGDIVSFGDQYWICDAETSLNDAPDNYNNWHDITPYSEYFQSKVSSNSGNDPRSDYEGSGDYWDTFYWNEYAPILYGENRLKGEWKSSSTYSYGNIVWKLDDNNKKIYYVTEYESELENADPENGFPWSKIGPNSFDEYFFSINSSNSGNDPRNGASYWEIYEPDVYDDRYTSDVTFQEIKSAFSEHKLVIGTVNRGVETTNEYFGKMFILTQVDVIEVAGDEMIISVRFAHDTFDADKMYLYGSLEPYNNQGSDPISLVRKSDSDYREASTLVIELNDETEDPAEKDNYRGEWDPTSDYDDGDIVHYDEDVTQKSNYYGTYDPTRAYDHFEDPIVYFYGGETIWDDYAGEWDPDSYKPEGYYYVRIKDNYEPYIDEEYVPKSGYFLVDATKETPKLGERYILKSYYSTEVTKNEIREALKAGKSVTAVRYGNYDNYDETGFFSDSIYTLVNNSVVVSGEMTSDLSLTRFVGVDQYSDKMVFLEDSSGDGDEYLKLYPKEYDSNNDEIISARTGADGTEYDSLQERLDTENAELKDEISAILTDDVKQALLNCFEHVAWVDNQGQTYYDALYDALYPMKTITAVFTQSGTVYETDSLDSLKTDLVVTYYADSQSAGVVVPSTDYMLSGTLTEGTSTITVTYLNTTTTFMVNVTADYAYLTAVYTQSGTIYNTDTLDSLKNDLVVTYYAHTYSAGTAVTSSDYTLSGTLIVGASTITAAYNGLTATFNVTVTPSSVLYSLPSATVFNGTSTYVDTGLKLAETDRDFTIAFTELNGNNSAVSIPVFHCITENDPWPGITFQRHHKDITANENYYFSGQVFVGSVSRCDTNVPATEGKLNRVVIRHIAGSNNYKIDSSTDGIVNTPVSADTSYFRASDKNMLLGCYQKTNGDKGRFFTGTIYDFTVYGESYPDEFVASYLSGGSN